MSHHLQSELKLHSYLTAEHWNGQALIGPDPGIRFDYRIGRFIKSYAPRLSWNDRLYYLQAQSYWILGNWRLFALTREETYRDIAVRCSESMREQQRFDGAWDYPNREWKGRVATAEGAWGALGLLETYKQTADPVFLRSALKWHKYLIDTVGFQRVGDELAVNYFANRAGARVPNNTAFVLRYLAELANVTGELAYLEPCTDLLTFMKRAQKPSGEFPYAVAGVVDGEERPHFQCYQYNAFQCLDLTEYYQLTKDTAALPIVTKLLTYLRTGLADDGHAFYACGNRHRAVTYHAAALGAAFAQADRAGIAPCSELAERAYTYVLNLQRSDGSFPYSRRDYGFLSDERSYPRYLAMILYHLQLKDLTIKNGVSREEKVQVFALN